KAYIKESDKYKSSDMTIKKLDANDVLVSLKVAGLNRRELSIANRMGNNKAPLVLGSDVAGVIESVGKNVSSVSVGDEVIINPALRWDKNSDAHQKVLKFSVCQITEQLLKKSLLINNKSNQNLLIYHGKKR